MGSRMFTMDRPSSSQEEARFLYATVHDCDPGRRNARQGIKGTDALLFPVGLYGFGMPNGVPFEVETTQECEACNTILKAWFQWRGIKVFDLGAKPKGQA